MDKFAEVIWTKTDLRETLEQKNIPATNENVNRLISELMDGCGNLEDILIDAGWNYIISAIENLNRDGEFVEELEPRCPRCGHPLDRSELTDRGYTYYCPQCDEDFYSFEAR